MVMETVKFDESDISYLAEHLSISQLRREIRTSRQVDKNLKALEQFDGTTEEDAYYSEIIGLDFDWRLWVDICQKALDEKFKLLRQEPKRKLETRITRERIDVELIKSNVDIVAVIESYGIDLNKYGADKFNGFCPFHDDRKTASFSVDGFRQSWHCFGFCNKGGDVISFVMLIEHCDFLRAISILRSF